MPCKGFETIGKEKKNVNKRTKQRPEAREVRTSRDKRFANPATPIQPVQAKDPQAKKMFEKAPPPQRNLPMKGTGRHSSVVHGKYLLYMTSEHQKENKNMALRRLPSKSPRAWACVFGHFGAFERKPNRTTHHL